MENPQHPVFAQAAAQRCSESEQLNKCLRLKTFEGRKPFLFLYISLFDFNLGVYYDIKNRKN